MSRILLLVTALNSEESQAHRLEAAVNTQRHCSTGTLVGKGKNIDTCLAKAGLQALLGIKGWNYVHCQYRKTEACKIRSLPQSPDNWYVLELGFEQGD